MGIVYTDEEIDRLRDAFYEYFVDRCLFCKYFTEETLVNNVSRYGYCNSLKLKVTESSICKNFIGL